MEHERKFLGRHIVKDPEICHGQPTFRGTRILVADILVEVARGTAWEIVSEQWDGRVSVAAIAEAVQLAVESFNDHADEHTIESVPA